MRTRSVARRTATAAAVLALATAGLAACSSGSSGSGNTASAGSGTGNISIWAHQGQDSEVAALKAAVDGFNKSQSKIKATLRLISENTYTTTITSTPTNQLPDVMELDGPTVAAFVYNAKVAPISNLVSKATIDNATDGAKAEGTSDGTLYALPQFDSALGLFANKQMLDAAGVKYPTSIDTAWTADQFAAALKTLAQANPSGKSLDIAEEYGLGAEWGTYAFSPLVWSAGGNLIANGKATGVMDSADSVRALTAFASWAPYVDSNADGNAFTDKRVAIGWGGHWMYPGYKKALGSDLIALPLPNMGNGAKTGAGSWTWGIGAGSKNGKAAGAFLDYLLNDANVKAMTEANGSVPATKTAFAADSLYQKGGDLALWGEQLQHACASDAITSDCVAVYRPVTAGYPTITAKFAGALKNIFGGANPQSELTAAAKAVDQDYADNDNYKK